ncbi:ADP-ribosyltransferase domain-containing protein [Jiangella alkaliphila]|uniref:NAD(+)--protein-arginine ADP-ribosyltransferase n=1 Tax=Jiangella alkaliphila TaxID=419479 RepID=A0A1H2M8F1_9ACTN|nr:ADP-ribosyltransferase domain-containing protein [Jiangella alkaliphila]SDU89449.1 NAD:arginine ADP-ribosyltransferase [Jiangella alkaliphila]
MVLSSSARPVRSAARGLAELSGLVHDGTSALAASVLSRVRVVGRCAGPALPPDRHDAVGDAAVAMRLALATAAATLTLAVESAADELGVLLRPAAAARGAARTTTGQPSSAHPLTRAQRRALRYYTTVEGVDEVNAFLRRPDDTPPQRRADLRRLVDDAVAGLAALPRFTGVVYRGTSLPAAQLPRWRPGVVVADSGFASASASASVAEAFRAGGNAFITIVGRTGADIRALSSFAHEAEVLFPPGTRFRVVGRSWDDRRECWSFLIEEVAACASTAPSTTG